MSIDKFIIIHKLLTDYKLQMKSEVSESLKCVHCRSVLKIACQVPCGCKLCRSCIENLISDTTADTCPGKSADCKEASLSEYVIDYQANKNILKLVVRCPEENCRHECDLSELENHLQNCPMKKVDCLFHEFGCDQKVVLGEINEHFLSENYQHFSKLIGFVSTVRNELTGLRRQCALKDQTIEFLTDEITCVKNENKLIKNQLKSIKHAISDDDHPPEELNSLGTNSIELVSIESISNRHRNNSVTAECNELRQWKDRINRDLAEMSRENSARQSELASRLSAVERNINRQIHAYYVWGLETVQTGQWVWSDFFRGSAVAYKHRLGLCNNSSNVQLYVVLYLHAGSQDSELPWPFRGSIGITINEKSKSKASKTIWRSCQLIRPPFDSYECTERFVFDYSDWTSTGVRLDTGLTVTCVICLY